VVDPPSTRPLTRHPLRQLRLRRRSGPRFRRFIGHIRTSKSAGNQPNGEDELEQCAGHDREQSGTLGHIRHAKDGQDSAHQQDRIPDMATRPKVWTAVPVWLLPPCG
jgi:hypothetical protein